MNTRTVTVLLIAASCGLLVSFQDCQQANPNTDIVGPLVLPCDGTSREITYTRPQGTTLNFRTLIIRPLYMCTGATIEYQNERNEWQQPRDWVPGQGAVPITPEVGAAYAVTVPRDKKLRLTCNLAETTTDSCRFVIVDASQQPSSAQRLVDTTRIDCNTWSPTKFFNFSGQGVRVQVQWADVCKNRVQGADRPQTPALRLRVMGQGGIAPLPAPGAVNLTGSTARWNGTVPANNSLELQCPGTIPGCRYLISYVRN